MLACLQIKLFVSLELKPGGTGSGPLRGSAGEGHEVRDWRLCQPAAQGEGLMEMPAEWVDCGRCLQW